MCASLGKSSLKAGLAAASVGLVLVLLYTIFYYRVLGVVVVAGLLATAALLWAIVSALGHSGLNLTLDLGHRRDRVRRDHRGLLHRVLAAVKGRGAQRAIGARERQELPRRLRTVLAADLVAAAVVLYAAVTVRGSAFFLGLSTLLDVFTTYFFARPLVILLGRNARITRPASSAWRLAVGNETAA